MQTVKVVRKTKPVDAIRVTEDNMREVAAWCNSLVIPVNGLGEKNPQPYIHVPVNNPRRPEDCRAVVGNWVIKEGHPHYNYRVVSDGLFKSSYDSVNGSPLSTPAKGSAPKPAAPKSGKKQQNVVPTPVQVGAVEVVPGTAPEPGSSLTTGKASVPNIVEAAAVAGVIDQATAAEARAEISDLEAHNTVARDFAAAEVDGDMVQLGQPVADELCDTCGSPVRGGVCTKDAAHITTSAAEITQQL